MFFINFKFYTRLYAPDFNPEMNVNSSGSIALSYHNDRGVSYHLSGIDNGFYFWIAQNQANEFDLVNTSNMTALSSANQLQTFMATLTSPKKAFLIELKPLKNTTSYLICIKYGRLPVLNSSAKIYDKCQLYCPNRNFVPFSRISD